MKRELCETVIEGGVIDEQLESDSKSYDNTEEAKARTGILELVTLDTGGSRRISEIVVGHLVGFEDSGAPLVDFPGNGSDRHLVARSIVNLRKDKVGREVVLMFEGGDPYRPVVMGLIQCPGETQSKEISGRNRRRIEAEFDGERLVFKADKEIVMRCGKASITLTRAGKLLLRGAYLLSRSSGVNRVKGGSVQIN